MKCEYNDCGKIGFAIEKVTGTDMKLCKEHFKELFQPIIQNAEIVELVDKESK